MVLTSLDKAELYVNGVKVSVVSKVTFSQWEGSYVGTKQKIVGLLGKAGSGKDTVADWLVQERGYVKISLADAMKRFAQKVFYFSTEQLWGPSQLRNEVDKRYLLWEAWQHAARRFSLRADGFLADLLADINDSLEIERARVELGRWFLGLPDYADGLSPRVALQTIGTEWGRAVDQLVWVRYATSLATNLLSGDHVYDKTVGLRYVGPGEDAPAGVIIPDCRFANEVQTLQHLGGQVVRVRRPGTESKEVGIVGHASEREQDSILDEDVDQVLVSPEGLENLYAELRRVFPGGES